MPSTIAQRKPKIRLMLASPRGFCAGVARAVLIVEKALEKYGAPVFVRHQIVHNQAVVNALEKKGAVFVETLDEIPAGAENPHVIFSAHGVAPEVVAEARAKNFFILDATCPLVSKVHAEVRRHREQGRHVFLIGHRDHPEIIGTIGHINKDKKDSGWSLIETLDDARSAKPSSDKTAFATQTTLSVSDTADIIAVLKERFPDIATPQGSDICYATTNRQNAVSAIAPHVDRFFVLGAENSSNAKRLVETAIKSGAPNAHLIKNSDHIPYEKSEQEKVWGLSAGASTPDFLIEETLADMQQHLELAIEENPITHENIVFPMPKELR